MDNDGKLDIPTASGDPVSAFRGARLPTSGLPALLFAFDPDPAAAGVWVG